MLNYYKSNRFSHYWHVNLRLNLNLNAAIGEFAEDARRRARKEYFGIPCTMTIQGKSSARQQTDLGKIASPLRLQMSEGLSRLNFTFWVKAQREEMHANYPIIQRNYFLQAFEVHNPG